MTATFHDPITFRPGDGRSGALLPPPAMSRAVVPVRPLPPLEPPVRLNLRRMTPRRMAEASFDLYVAGHLDWEEYAMIAFQPELHPLYDRTIGALTGQMAAPDRPRDFIAEWEERLAFALKHHRGHPLLVRRTQRIVNLFHRIEASARTLRMG